MKNALKGKLIDRSKKVSLFCLIDGRDGKLDNKDKNVEFLNSKFNCRNYLKHKLHFTLLSQMMIKG